MFRSVRSPRWRWKAGLAASFLIASVVFPAVTGSPTEAALPGTNGEIAFTINGVGIYVMDDGATYQQLGFWPHEGHDDHVLFPRNDGANGAGQPAWSPDGSKLAFEWSGGYLPDLDGNPSTNGEWCGAGTRGIGVVDIVDASPFYGVPRCLVDTPSGDYEPTWSPDGTEVAFISAMTGTSLVYVVDATTGALREVSHRNAADPSWSPDGQLIAFSSLAGPANYNREIYVAHADGTSGVTRLTDNSVEEARPDWSPDGTKIAFEARTDIWDAPREIVAVDADGTNRTQLTDATYTDEHDPAWSPDGSKILFQAPAPSGDSFLYELSIESSTYRQLTFALPHDNRAKVHAGSPAWQPIAPIAEPGLFLVDPDIDVMCGWDWPAEAAVTVTVNDEVHPDITTTDANGGFCIWWYPPFAAIDVGDTVTVSVYGASLAHVVLDLAVTEVDPFADTVSGTAPDGVWVRVVVESDPARPMAFGQSIDGSWTVDFSATHDIQPGDQGAAVRDGLNNNKTKQHWWVPEVHSVTGPVDPVLLGTEVAVVGSFTDSDYQPHLAEWDWGDGTTSPGIVDEAWGNGTVTGTHTYVAPGVYTVTLSVANSDGAFHRSAYEFVVVYDPDGGFVTGAGWIESPAGALKSDPDAEGRAMFGFTSKYRHGASTPDGNTMFRFRTGDLSFRSTSYDWLVVTGGDTARFKGSGTINGELSPSGEPYRFMIWADDGADDSFRIKIWTESNGELVVYDNGSNQPIGAGQVVVHS